GSLVQALFLLILEHQLSLASSRQIERAHRSSARPESDCPQSVARLSARQPAKAVNDRFLIIRLSLAPRYSFSPSDANNENIRESPLLTRATESLLWESQSQLQHPAVGRRKERHSARLVAAGAGSAPLFCWFKVRLQHPQQFIFEKRSTGQQAG